MGLAVKEQKLVSENLKKKPKWPVYHNGVHGCGKIGLYIVIPNVKNESTINADCFLPLTWASKPFKNGDLVICGSCGENMTEFHSEWINYNDPR